MQPGFTAESGSVFTAKIEPCASCDENNGSRSLPVQRKPVDLANQPSDPMRDMEGVTLHNIENSGLSLYPNPTDGTVTVESTGGVLIEIIMVYDSFGRIVATYEINDLLGTFDMHSLHGGLYLLRAQMSDGTVQSGKVMKL